MTKKYQRKIETRSPKGSPSSSTSFQAGRLVHRTNPNLLQNNLRKNKFSIIKKLKTKKNESPQIISRNSLKTKLGIKFEKDVTNYFNSEFQLVDNLIYDFIPGDTYSLKDEMLTNYQKEYIKYFSKYIKQEIVARINISNKLCETYVKKELSNLFSYLQIIPRNNNNNSKDELKYIKEIDNQNKCKKIILDFLKLLKLKLEDLFEALTNQKIEDNDYIDNCVKVNKKNIIQLQTPLYLKNNIHIKKIFEKVNTAVNTYFLKFKNNTHIESISSSQLNLLNQNSLFKSSYNLQKFQIDILVNLRFPNLFNNFNKSICIRGMPFVIQAPCLYLAEVTVAHNQKSIDDKYEQLIKNGMILCIFIYTDFYHNEVNENKNFLYAKEMFKNKQKAIHISLITNTNQLLSFKQFNKAMSNNHQKNKYLDQIVEDNFPIIRASDEKFNNSEIDKFIMTRNNKRVSHGYLPAGIFTGYLENKNMLTRINKLEKQMGEQINLTKLMKRNIEMLNDKVDKVNNNFNELNDKVNNNFKELKSMIEKINNSTKSKNGYIENKSSKEQKSYELQTHSTSNYVNKH